MKPTKQRIQSSSSTISSPHPDVTVHYKASGMVLHIHSDASYFSEAKARLRAGGKFYLSEPFREPPTSTSELPPHNGAIHVLITVLKNVKASANEAELGALFLNTREAATL